MMVESLKEMSGVYLTPHQKEKTDKGVYFTKIKPM